MEAGTVYSDPNVMTYPAPDGCPDLDCAECGKPVVKGGLTFDRFGEGITITQHLSGESLAGLHAWCVAHPGALYEQKRLEEEQAVLKMGKAAASTISTIFDLLDDGDVASARMLAQQGRDRFVPFFDAR